MVGPWLGCMSVAMAVLVYLLAREIRLRRTWQQLWLCTWDQEQRNAEAEDAECTEGARRTMDAGNETAEMADRRRCSVGGL
jgi:hypothetical protein